MGHAELLAPPACACTAVAGPRLLCRVSGPPARRGAAPHVRAPAVPSAGAAVILSCTPPRRGWHVSARRAGLRASCRTSAPGDGAWPRDGGRGTCRLPSGRGRWVQVGALAGGGGVAAQRKPWEPKEAAWPWGGGTEEGEPCEGAAEPGASGCRGWRAPVTPQKLRRLWRAPLCPRSGPWSRPSARPHLHTGRGGSGPRGPSRGQGGGRRGAAQGLLVAAQDPSPPFSADEGRPHGDHPAGHPGLGPLGAHGGRHPEVLPRHGLA